MRPSMSQLMHLDFDALIAVADTVTEKINQITKQLEQARNQAADFFNESWTGSGKWKASSQAAHDTIVKQFSQSDTTLAEANELIDHLRHVSSELSELRDQILSYLNGHHNYTDYDEAGVFHPKGDITSPEVYQTAEREAVYYTDKVQELLDHFDATDNHAARDLTTMMQKLDELANKTVFDDSAINAVVQEVQHGDTKGIPSDPQEFHKLWASLNAREKELLFEADPAIGNHAGMSVQDKNFFNNRHLETLIHDHPENTGLQDFKKALESVEDQKHHFNVFIDDKGHGAIASGDTDYADRVITFIPGTGENLSKIEGGGLQRVNNMVNSIQKKIPKGQHAAGVSWYGYDAPPGLDDAMWPDRAENGAQALDEFAAGQRSTNEVGGKMFVVGHSYGSTLLGAAASHGHTLDADGMIFCGSPGTTVNRASELSMTHVPPDEIAQHVFATRIDTDPVPEYGLTHALGPNPTREDYGGTIFDSQKGHGMWYEFGYNYHNHSDYFNKETLSLDNVTNIAADLPLKKRE